jgi:hypothetical protein
MTVALDHLFICTDAGAPEADHLVTFGLAEGTPNQHPGQGTANRRFFFHNAMLEVLWVCDAAEAQSDPIRRTQLWERWSQRATSASPFGICLRSTNSDDATVPFPAWEYRPPYLPDPVVIHIGVDTPLSEPMWFYLGLGQRPDSAPREQRQTLDHPVGFREITSVRLTTQVRGDLSLAAQTVVETHVISEQPGPEDLLELGFDDELQGKQQDFRPVLPLVFHW